VGDLAPHTARAYEHTVPFPGIVFKLLKEEGIRGPDSARPALMRGLSVRGRIATLMDVGPCALVYRGSSKAPQGQLKKTGRPN
jgi:hypothetical protein